jgi:predicted metal-dependent hydrolase
MMPTHFDWTTGPLAQGLHCYRTRQFFEAHEHWEAVWLTLAEPEKSFLQSLVQISAAFHHLRRGNRIGTVSLLTRSLRRLNRSPAHFCGVAVERLRRETHIWLAALESGAVDLPPTFPAIEIYEPNDLSPETRVRPES